MHQQSRHRSRLGDESVWRWRIPLRSLNRGCIGSGAHLRPARPASAQPLPPWRQVPASMAFVTDSNAPNRFGNLLQPSIKPPLGPPTRSLPAVVCLAPAPSNQHAHTHTRPPREDGLGGGWGGGGLDKGEERHHDWHCRLMRGPDLPILPT